MNRTERPGCFLRFLLVGDGPLAPQLRNALDPYARSGLVTFTGAIPHKSVRMYLDAADILVSPHVPMPGGRSFFGSPTKLFEYMAMGKAIIAPDLDQIGHVFRNSLKAGELPDESPQETESRIAILMQPGDIQQLVEAIRFIAVEPTWRAKLGMNARAEALSKYTWAHHVQEILGRVRSLNLISDRQTRSLLPLGATE